MKKQVLFVHGGGDDGYKSDAPLAASLQTALGDSYEVHYPQILPDESIEDVAPYWLGLIEQALAAAKDGIILVGHSLGASMLIKYLSENTIPKGRIAGVFLAAPPFWSGTQDWVLPLKLQEGFAARYPADLPTFFYQCQDDDVVPFDHFIHYQQQLPGAVFRTLESGGHQLHEDFSLVAADVKTL